MKDGWLEPQIYLVRHGHHPEGFRGGWSQHSLSHLGRVQASLLADRFLSEGARVDMLISSDLPRAKETAEILGSALDVPLCLTGEWREVNNGELAGMPNDQAEARYPGLYWSSLEMNQAYPGGESPAQFRSRIEGAFRSLCELIEKGYAGPRVMVVTHGGPIRVVLSLVSGILWSNKGPQQRLHETGISCLVRAGNVWKITCQDDARHLSGVSVHRLSNPGGEEVDAIIHPLTTRDLERFLAWRGGDDYIQGRVRNEVEEHFAGKRVLLVAEVQGLLAGTVEFVPYREDGDTADGKTTAYLQALEVDPDFRGHGLGTRLIEALSTLPSRGASGGSPST